MRMTIHDRVDPERSTALDRVKSPYIRAFKEAFATPLSSLHAPSFCFPQFQSNAQMGAKDRLRKIKRH